MVMFLATRMVKSPLTRCEAAGDKIPENTGVCLRGRVRRVWFLS